MGSYPTRQPSS